MEARLTRLVAHYEKEAPVTYNVNVSYDANCGTASADPSLAAAGTTVTLTATANEGYVFAGWSVGNGSNVELADKTKAITTFTMPNNAVAVKATFEAILYDITVQVQVKGNNVASASAITISVNGNDITDAKAKVGDSVTIKIPKIEGYKLESFSVNQRTAEDPKSYVVTFTMPAHDADVVVVLVDEDNVNDDEENGGNGSGDDVEDPTECEHTWKGNSNGDISCSDCNTIYKADLADSAVVTTASGSALISTLVVGEELTTENNYHKIVLGNDVIEEIMKVASGSTLTVATGSAVTVASGSVLTIASGSALTVTVETYTYDDGAPFSTAYRIWVALKDKVTQFINGTCTWYIKSEENFYWNGEDSGEIDALNVSGADGYTEINATTSNYYYVK